MLNMMARAFQSCKILFVAAMTEFCLQKLDNKYFKLHLDFLEDYLANHAGKESEMLFTVGQMRKVCLHPKTTYSEHYLDLLQNILMHF